MPEYFISHRVITSSEGGNFLSRTLVITAVQDVSPSSGFNVKSHLNATVSKDYGLEAIDQSLLVATQRPVTNYEFGKLRRKRRRNCKYLVSTIVLVRLEPGNSGGRIRGN